MSQQRAGKKRQAAVEKSLTIPHTELQAMIESVEVKSLANGHLLVIPKWRGVRKYTPASGGGPGMLTRLSGAVHVEGYLNAHLFRKEEP